MRRLALLVFGAALILSRGLFAQDEVPDTLGVPAVFPVAAADAVLRLRALDRRYVQPDTPVPATPRAIRALYVNAWAFSSRRLWQLVSLADSTEINALVVDVKDDTGCLLYPSAVATAREIGADDCVHLHSIAARMDTLRAHGIYPIARIVVAKDPLLARGKTEWSIRDRRGGLWRDRQGTAWVDAYNDSVWVYAAQLAREAVGMGFREVQFDYVRFPDEPPSRLAEAVYPARRDGERPHDSIRRHVELLKQQVGVLGVPVTTDIFGLTASATGDLGIGQVWEDFVAVADVVLPMVYPSHYRHGAFGFARPNSEPYLIVHRALSEAVARTRGLAGAAQIRPYLQAFTLGRPRYSPFEIREQIRAAEELGCTSWVLWNPRSVYPRDALRPYPSEVRARSASAGGGD
ncbi:MAG TPA: putative glycoside hydrolase [Gemmatimonadales bacterium]|nr:putative glycoside hydrolase [Gemmatimonadales bacterium]